jgi:hypothetical protein
VGILYLCGNITLYLYGYTVLYCICVRILCYGDISYLYCICVRILYLCRYIVLVCVECNCVGILYLGRYILFYGFIVFV